MSEPQHVPSPGPENPAWKPKKSSRTFPFKMLAWIVGIIAAVVAITSQGRGVPLAVAGGFLLLAIGFAAVAALIGAIEDR